MNVKVTKNQVLKLQVENLARQGLRPKKIFEEINRINPECLSITHTVSICFLLIIICFLLDVIYF